MPPIHPSEIGDVWPAAQPGRPGDYGSAKLDPTDPVEIRSYQTLTVTYTVGKFGLDDTGAIMVGFRWVNDCGPLQISDPAAMNYVTAFASNGATLELFIEPYGYRPWNLAIRVTVQGGFLREGDTIDVVFGDTSHGSPGFRMQTIAEAAFEMKVSVDACATGHFTPLPDQLFLPIIAGQPHQWNIIAPSLRRPDEPFFIGIRVDDIWGNPTEPGPVTIHLFADSSINGLPKVIHFQPGQRSIEVNDLNIQTQGTTRIHMRTPDGALLATSNPIVVQDGAHAGYWGDLHGQSGETVGIGTIDEYLGFARDLAFLDVSGHQANDFQITNAFWQRINDVTTALNEDARFVVFPGYEWSGNTPVGGDHNVFFCQPDRQIVRSSHAELTDRSDLDTDANTLNALFDALQGEDAVVWSHVGGRPADVSFAHDPILKTAVEVHSNWGTFEWILTDSLALGHRVGVVANSDGHKGRPGAGPPGATEFGAYGGLTCFLTPELSRDAIFECMRRRHHYGTSGSRISLNVSTTFSAPADLYDRDPRHFMTQAVETRTAIMGDIVHLQDQDVSLEIRIDAPATIERVDIMNGADSLQTLRTYGPSDLGKRIKVCWQGAEYRGRGRNTHWTGSIRARKARFKSVTPVNNWNHERELAIHDDGSIAFEAVTSGNFAGVDLALSDLDGKLEISTNLVSGSVAINDLGLEDWTLDAGGLERMVRIRRLPDQLDDLHFNRTLPLDLASGEEHAIWVRVTTMDGHQAWSSPIYLERK